MTPRQTLHALFAALLLTGAAAGAASAATEHPMHKMHAMSHSRSGHMHAMPAASRHGSSQDHMADQLNAQSLEHANGGAMQAPAQPMMGHPAMGQPGMVQPGMGAAPGAAQ